MPSPFSPSLPPLPPLRPPIGQFLPYRIFAAHLDQTTGSEFTTMDIMQTARKQTRCVQDAKHLACRTSHPTWQARLALGERRHAGQHIHKLLPSHRCKAADLFTSEEHYKYKACKGYRARGE